MESIDQQVQAGLNGDIKLLGGMLKDVLRRLSGESAYHLSEAISESAIALRDAPSVDHARQLRDRLEQLDLPSLRMLIRAFSVFFDLVNLAEQQARVRANRLRVIELAPEPLGESPEAAKIGRAHV